MQENNKINKIFIIYPSNGLVWSSKIKLIKDYLSGLLKKSKLLMMADSYD